MKKKINRHIITSNVVPSRLIMSLTFGILFGTINRRLKFPGHIVLRGIEICNIPNEPLTLDRMVLISGMRPQLPLNGLAAWTH
jgi:hypothetical protein